LSQTFAVGADSRQRRVVEQQRSSGRSSGETEVVGLAAAAGRAVREPAKGGVER